MGFCADAKLRQNPVFDVHPRVDFLERSVIRDQHGVVFVGVGGNQQIHGLNDDSCLLRVRTQFAVGFGSRTSDIEPPEIPQERSDIFRQLRRFRLLLQPEQQFGFRNDRVVNFAVRNPPHLLRHLARHLLDDGAGGHRVKDVH